MSSFNKVIALTVILFAALFTGANLLISGAGEAKGRQWDVEAERLVRAIEQGSGPDLSGCESIIRVTADDGTPEFYSRPGTAVYREAAGTVYRFDYDTAAGSDHTRLVMNLSIAAAAAVSLLLLIHLKRRLIKPFNKLSELPFELSRGNLAAPLKEEKSRYFGKFIWGTDMLRESLEKQKQRELAFQRDKQTMLLSVSHDIKTPLSAIKLSAKALSKGIYTDPAKLAEVYEGIGARADEIEKYVSQLTAQASDDFLSLEVGSGEMYLSELISGIRSYYTEKLSVLGTELVTAEFGDCLISCDPDRAVEVLQNVMENAIKYGDGRRIEITVSEEEDCRLVTVSNGGCTLRDDELIHIFDSFTRGTNAQNKPGSGLGLYICRRLMNAMDGDIFARTENGNMHVTVVFRKA